VSLNNDKQNHRNDVKHRQKPQSQAQEAVTRTR
jgi:hypothetical protein